MLGAVRALTDEMASSGSRSCRDEKEFVSVFVFRYLEDRQVEVLKTSHGHDQCTADFAPALGQVKTAPSLQCWKVFFAECES
jgi:hypothetical protein